MTDQDLDQIRAVMQDMLAPIESRLDRIDARLDRTDGRLDRIDGNLAALRTDIDAVNGKIDTWPDLHFLQAAAQQQIRDANEARERSRYVEIKLGEIYGSMATSSEIEKLRKEVGESLDHARLLDLRVSAIESRLGIRNPLAPTE